MTLIETGEFALVANTRRLRGLVTPFGETGTNASGEFNFSAGSVTLPRADLDLWIGHEHKQHLGRSVLLEQTDRGVEAEFEIDPGLVGDRFMAEYERGKKHNLSAEFANVVREGKNVVSSVLTGVAAVVLGGFESAAFFELATAEAPTDDEIQTAIDVLTRVQSHRNPEQTTEDAAATEATTPETPAADKEEEAIVPIPDTLEAAPAIEASPVTKAEAFAIYSAAAAGRATPEMLERLKPGTVAGEHAVFALTDVKYDGTGSVQPDERRSQWLDELWSGRTYVQQVLPLFAHDTLTSKKVEGFRWTTKPTGATWAGNKSNIPSNQPATAPADATAEFWAMGHDHAIEHQLFDTPGYFPSYFAAGAESYAQWADAKVLAAALAGATSLEADDPTGLTIGAGFSALIDGAAAVILANALPTFALVAPALWKQMMKTPDNAVLGYLDAALGLEAGTLGASGFVIRPHASIATGSALVGAREALSVYELSGLLRVTAPDTVKGGIDTNMIGALATLVHKPTALQLVTPYTP